MSGRKTKADLTALFKLEFYRRQSNWKFCSQVHKVQKEKKADHKDETKTPPVQPVQQPDKNCLNKTYNVVSEPADNVERSDLNNAFVESDNDKNISPQDSPNIPDKDWSPKFIRPSDKWVPKDSQTDDVPNVLPSPEIDSQIDCPNLNPNLPRPDQNWNENVDQEYLYDQEKRDCNLPWTDWLVGAKENQNLQEMYPQETQFDPNWLQQQMVRCRQTCINRQVYYQSQKDLKVCEQQNLVMQSWANIATQSYEKYQDLNNNNNPPSLFSPTKETPEPVFENWQEWKETQLSLNTLQNCPEEWQNGMIWQDYQCKELPEMDKEGYEGTEAGWPVETQTWINHKFFSEDLWSEDVLRELELLNAQNMEPEVPAPPREKWVPPDRLLQWMLANKECCEDVLETSCDSEEQFIRAIQCVPHSTEIDIRPQADALDSSLELECVNLLSDAVGTLSEAALLAAGRAHARALRRVARELRNREQRPHSAAYPAIAAGQYDASCEEYPTRDIGLYQPSFIDTFISGSYKNNPNIKTLDVPKEKDLDQNINYNQLCIEAGRIVVDRRIKVNRARSDLNMGQSDLNMGQSDLNMGQSGLNMGQSGLNMGQSGVNMGQSNLNMGQSGLNMGESCLNMDQSGLNMGQSGINMGQSVLNIGQSGLNQGQCDFNKGQTGLNMGQSDVNVGQNCHLAQNSVERVHMDLEMGLDRNYLYHNRPDISQMGQIGQPGSFGDYNAVGRGRGRLVLMENQIVPGRGRGRI